MLSVRLKQYYDPLRRPPGTTSTSRWCTGYRTRRSSGTRRPPGRGGPPQFPSPPSERSTPPTPESPSRLHSRLYTASMAFTLIIRARHSLLPTRRRGPLTTRQASLDAADRSVASPARAFDAGLRRRAFPPDAASLLPGLLAATRTGLSPAGDDELAMSDQLNSITSIFWAHIPTPITHPEPASATAGTQQRYPHFADRGSVHRPHELAVDSSDRDGAPTLSPGACRTPNRSTLRLRGAADPAVGASHRIYCSSWLHQVRNRSVTGVLSCLDLHAHGASTSWCAPRDDR